MSKQNLLTIKEFASLCNVHPAALRRYDAIGVLKPAFTDPETGYRYYSIFQRGQVVTIQFAIEAGLPLKELAKYMNDQTSSIQYNKVLDSGTDILEKRIKSLQHILQDAKRTFHEIRRAEEVNASDVPLRYTLDGGYYWIKPCSDNVLEIDTAQEFRECLTALTQVGLSTGCSAVMQRRSGDKWEQLLAFRIEGNPEGLVDKEHLFFIPTGEWLCKRANSLFLDDVWNWSAPYINPEDIEIIIETELTIGNYNFYTPVMEQRCLLKYIV